MNNAGKFKIGVTELERLFNHFAEKKYKNIGPVLRDGAICISEIDSFDLIPKGVYELINQGSYKTVLKKDESLFQYTVGPQSFKSYFHPKRRQLWTAHKSEKGFTMEQKDPEVENKVLWAIRPCDLSSLLVLDNVFNDSYASNKDYQLQREETFIIAVNCTNPSSNCFCTSTGTGPKALKGFDILLTEVFTETDHYMICKCGNPEAEELCLDLGFSRAVTLDIHKANELTEAAEEKMTGFFDSHEVRDLLSKSYSHKHWLDLDKKCLACANCTMVCPTCFCTVTEDITDLEGKNTERWLSWDSCFNADYSYIHGGGIRKSISSRYRQWITHKLSTWHDQFGQSGCVGCGRCITWCPVGIDIREEVSALQPKKNDRTQNQNDKG